MIDEEIRHKRALEIPTGASSPVPVIRNRRNTDIVEVYLGTNECDPSDDLAGSKNPDPFAC